MLKLATTIGLAAADGVVGVAAGAVAGAGLVAVGLGAGAMVGEAGAGLVAVGLGAGAMVGEAGAGLVAVGLGAGVGALPPVAQAASSRPARSIGKNRWSIRTLAFALPLPPSCRRYSATDDTKYHSIAPCRRCQHYGTSAGAAAGPGAPDLC
jgi:hypothetical protein